MFVVWSVPESGKLRVQVVDACFSVAGCMFGRAGKIQTAVQDHKLHAVGRDCSHGDLVPLLPELERITDEPSCDEWCSNQK
jgi:predicted aminopeptidase